MPDPALARLLDRRFITITGKGGTGKTTVAAALSLLAMQRNKRVLVCMAQAKERLSAMLETEYIGSEVKPILGTIDAVNMDPDACIDEYGRMVLRVKALYKAVMDNRVVKGFLHAVPGLDAWSMLGKALYHAKAEKDGRPEYDLVILDAPATGHGLQMLKVPQVICDVAPPGLLRREAEDGLAKLRDPKHSAVVVCALPEEMPTAETEDLVKQLREPLQMPPAALVVNMALAHLFDGKVDPARKAAEVLEGVPAFAPLAGTIRSRITREGIQGTMLQRLANLRIPTAVLPALPIERGLKRANVQQLAGFLASGGV